MRLRQGRRISTTFRPEIVLGRKENEDKATQDIISFVVEDSVQLTQDFFSIR